MMQIKFTVEPDHLMNTWAVYRLLDAQAAIQFVGHCRLSQLAALPDARANVHFRAIFPPGRPMTIEVVNLARGRVEAQNLLWQYIRAHGRPFMVAHGVRPGMKGTPVICVDTGERFNTLTECCQAHGISGSALSNHLANKPGYATVKGKTYARGAAAVRPDRIAPTPAPAVRPDEKGGA